MYNAIYVYKVRSTNGKILENLGTYNTHDTLTNLDANCKNRK